MKQDQRKNYEMFWGYFSFYCYIDYILITRVIFSSTFEITTLKLQHYEGGKKSLPQSITIIASYSLFLSLLVLVTTISLFSMVLSNEIV